MYLFVKQKKTKQKLKINKLEKFILRVLQKKQKNNKKTNSTGKHNAKAANRMGGGDIKIHRVKLRHRVCGHDTIAILLV